ncbi:hypothetical protein LOZ53_001486 [Ophidiomyces ophidiicola]|nr:hypothetical protein LOZ55_002955 [Ophidiomyces ophidiicola]KAI1985652.1 hypothetical protein LOZ51_006271 [Ophidiomyces ophidiicola]KAI1995074.1 hypothetical protein LOZ54_000745 [Ophidiomyces ophidiicola]KAI1995256.1 hypothetical protein LOZ53_001486 [Ophidiomyces ophidiicola]
MPGLKNQIELAPCLFPDDPIFSQLRRFSKEVPGNVIHDEYGSIDASYDDLINDVIHLRQVLQRRLPDTSFDERGILQDHATSIAFLGFSSYNFIISFLAIAALGGNCVPLKPGIALEKTTYFLNKSDATCVLTEAETLDYAEATREYIKAQSRQELDTILISRATSWPKGYAGLELSEYLSLPPCTGCLVLFTSGTLGQPKGAILPRQLFYFTEGQEDPTNFYLASSPIHWIGGAMGLLISVLNGERMHIMKSESGPEQFWEILKDGKITIMSLPPRRLRAMMEYYNDNIRDFSPQERDKYVNGLRSLHTVLPSGAMLNPSARKFFKDLVNMPIKNGYGITEMGGGVMITPDGWESLERCIGTPLPGFSVKLSDGDRGELLVKSDSMFVGYINDEERTRKAFDDEGFYKTGDYVHRIGDKYFFDGRVSSDWIPVYDKKVPILAVEQCLMNLPYISEAHILPVLDHEASGVVAALVRPRKRKTTGEEYERITLQKIREDLAAAKMSWYKLPTLLRVLQDDEEVPMTASDKILKQESLRKYFQISGYMPEGYAVDGVEYRGNKALSTK